MNSIALTLQGILRPPSRGSTAGSDKEGRPSSRRISLGFANEEAEILVFEESEPPDSCRQTQ